MPGAKQLVVFDVDGTLVTGRHSEPGFIRYLAKRGVLGPRQYLAMVAFWLRYLPRYGRHTGKKNKAYLTGLAVADIEVLAREYVEQELVSRLFAPAKARLLAHQQLGDPAALLTGAPQFLAQPLAQHLEVTAVCATLCAQQDGRFTAALPDSHPFADDKLAGAHHLCQRYGCKLSQVTAYADSIYDLPLLKAVGRAVAVRPDRGLRQYAENQCWEILEAPAKPS